MNNSERSELAALLPRAAVDPFLDSLNSKKKERRNYAKNVTDMRKNQGNRLRIRRDCEPNGILPITAQKWKEEDERDPPVHANGGTPEDKKNYRTWAGVKSYENKWYYTLISNK